MRRLETFTLVLAFLLTLCACGGEPVALDSPPQDGDGGEAVIYDCGGLQAALPSKYIDKLRVETEFADSDRRWKPLISVYDQASWNGSNGTGGGFIFGLAQLDQATFEQMLGAEGSGVDIFATDGEFYYIYTYPTDVQFSRPTADGSIDTKSDDWKEWEELNEIGPAVRDDFLTRNSLQSFSMKDFTDPLTAEDENHICLRYYPYFLKDGDTRIYYHLFLRQPAQQGGDGIWAVDQWMDEHGNPYLYFPDSGKPAAEYYAQLQRECDAGQHPEYRTPAGAAAFFARNYFGHDTAEGSFQEVREVDHGYMERNARLEEMALHVMFEQDIDGIELLDLVGEATIENWGVLGRSMYGSDWFQPLMDAVAKAAVGTDQLRRDRAVMSFLLATQDALTDFRTPLSAVLQAQKEADPDAWQAAQSEFSEEDQEILLGASIKVQSAPMSTDLPELVEALPVD